MTVRILIIDDDSNMRMLLKDYFEFFGYEVSCFERAGDALPKVETECFDIVITDYFMPDMDGVEFTRFVRQINPSLPIIGISSEYIERKFLDSGANQFMTKPFDLKRLKEAVDNHLKAL